MLKIKAKYGFLFNSMRSGWKPAISVFLLFLSIAFPQQYPIKHYTPESPRNPLYTSSIYDVIQDSEGFMWFANYSAGLIRYDGISMELYTQKEGLPGLTTISINQDSTGRLWLLTDLGVAVTEKPLKEYGINDKIFFSDTLFQLPLVQTSVSQVAYHALHVDYSGDIWVGTTALGVIRYHYSEGMKILTADTFSTGLRGQKRNSIVFSLSGGHKLPVFAAVEGGLLYFDRVKRQFDDAQNKTSIKTSNIHALFENPHGVLYGGSSEGQVWKYNGSEYTELKPGLNDVIWSFFWDDKDNLWIGTQNNGAFIVGPKSNIPINKMTTDNGLLSNTVRSINQDIEGNIWFAHLDGISKLRYNYPNFRYIRPRYKTGLQSSGISSSSTSSVLPPEDKSKEFPLWVVSQNGIVLYQDFNQFTLLNSDKGLKNNVVYDIIRDRNDRIWLGNLEGVECISPHSSIPGGYPGAKNSKIVINGKDKTISFFDIGITGVCNQFFIKDDGQNIETLWFNGYRRLVAFMNNRWYFFDEASGIPPSIIYSVDMDEDQRIWVGTGDKGLFASPPLTKNYLESLPVSPRTHRVQSPVFKSVWDMENGAPANDFVEVLSHGDTLFLGTSIGLFVVDKQEMRQLKSFSQDNMFLSANIVSMTRSIDQKSIWIGTNSELLALNIETLDKEYHLTRADGLLSGETFWIEGVQQGKNGLIYMANPNGLTIFDPQNYKKTNVIVPLKIWEMVVSNDNWGVNLVSAKYALFSFINENQNKYRVLLDGYDRGWSPLSDENEIRYTSLPAYFFDRPYTLKIKGVNAEKKLNPTISETTIVISPPYFFRWWAFAFYALLLTGIGFFVYWFGLHWREYLIPKRRRISHFKILESLGKGGMGEVFRAKDLITGKIVALKILISDLLEDPENRRRLVREGQLLASLESQYVVKTFEVGEYKGLAFFAMEYLPGGTLREYLKQHQPIPMKEIADFALQICSGIGDIHNNRIIHRDLKTGNIMFDSDGKLRIMDFGLSKSPLATTMSVLGTVLGTLGYVAPEQITNVDVDERVDIFSFGALLYELVTGNLPFSGENEIAIIHSIFNNHPPSLSENRNDLLPGFEQIILKCLEKEPGNRFQEMDEIKKELLKLDDPWS